MKKVFWLNVLVVFSLCSAVGCSGNPSETNLEKHSTNAQSQLPLAGGIEGAVYVTLKSGESQLIRGADVALIKETPDFLEGMAQIKAIENVIQKYNYTIIESNEKVRDSIGSMGWQDCQATVKLVINSVPAGYIPAEKHLGEVLNYMHSRKYASTRTNIDAKFDFGDLEEGTYYVFSTYTNQVSKGYWLEKITILSGQRRKIELSNFNMSDADFYYNEITNLINADFRDELEACGLAPIGSARVMLEMLRTIEGASAKTVLEKEGLSYPS